MEKKTDLKTLSPKARITYIWDYYKWHILVTIVIVAFTGSMVHHYATYRDPFLSVIMINSNDSYNTNTSGFDEFLDVYGYDSAENPVTLASGFRFTDDANATSYTDYQALTAIIAAGDGDLFFGTGDVYLNYCKQGALLDLSTVLSPELLAEYEDSLIYTTADDTSEPFPCAIELTDNAWLSKHNYYSTCYFGIFSHAPNLENSTQFAEFLLTYE